ncbi:MAG: hypothetical protein QW046_04140, partial [Candidatus Micrarchaeaceae archaeon]
MAKTLKKMLISTIVVLMMVLSAAFIGISSNVNAQPSASPKSIGTFTLNPATGAFPGELVTYTWIGVPSTLVPPVYVTVYLNNTPYGNPTIATYNSTSGTLTGTFIMPNAEPGTVFMVSLSYKDSAQNYGVSSSSIPAGGNVYGAPITQFSTYTITRFGAPYVVKANVNYSKIQKTIIEFNGGNGQVSGYTNSTFNVISPDTKTIMSKNTGIVNLVGYTNYKEQFFTNQSTQTLSINATLYNAGPAYLSLAATSIFHSTFGIDSSKKQIGNISLLAYLNQTVNGQPVNFTITGKYTSPITSNGTYTMLGTIKATGKSPSQLKNDFSGSISASYDINFWFNTANTLYLNYTLSVKITGGTSNGVLTLNAQYLNSTFIHIKTTQTGIYYIYSNDNLTVQSGYTFVSTYIGLENPGIAGKFVQNFSTTFSSKKLWTGNLTFRFTNYTMGKVSNIVVWYDNQSVKMYLLNQTLNGYMNITVGSNLYNPAVEYISPAVWNVTLTVRFNLTNQYGLMLYNTSKYSVERQININITSLLAPGQTAPWSGNVTITPPSTFVDKLGYLYLNSVTVPYISFTLTYGSQSGVVMQNATWTGNVNLSVGKPINGYNVNSTVKGFNVALVSSSGIKLWVTVSMVNPVIYALGGIGSVSIADVNVTGIPIWTNAYIKEDYTANFTTPITMTITNVWGAISRGTNTNLTYVNFTLNEELGSVNYAEITSGKVLFESPYFTGNITMTGKSNSNIGKALIFSPGNKEVSNGTITSISGFGNTTILGWYNTTFTVYSVAPALYGGLFNGYAIIQINITIQNVSHSLNIDPWFAGEQNVSSLNLTIISNTTVYNNVTFTKQPDLSQNLTLTGYGRIGYLNDFTLSSSFNITNSLYNLTDNFEYLAKVNKVSFFNSTQLSVFYQQMSYVSGDVPVSIINSTLILIAYIGSPIQNLTLSPIANISFKIYFNASTVGYDICNGFITNKYYSTSFSNTNNTIFKISPTTPAVGSAAIKATVEESQIVIQALVNNAVITTNPFYVANPGEIPVVGLVTADHGIGTVSGILTVSKIYPTSIDEIKLSGILNATIFNANDTQYGISLIFSNTPIMLNTEATVLVPIRINAIVNYINETSNTKITNNSISYQLIEGSGALIVNVTNSTIATIVSKLNQTIQVPLSELNAKITGINGTLVSIETAFGYMNSTLQTLNAKITVVNGSLVTIKTDLGYMNTTLQALVPVINEINGNVVTIKTVVGNINYNLTQFKDWILVNITNGIAQLQASLNGVNVSLHASLNALNGNIAYVNGTTIWLKTNLGYMNTTLQALVPVINEINGNVVTIKTVVGNINYNLTQFKDWILVNITNGIAQLQASLNGVNVSLHASLNALNGN